MILRLDDGDRRVPDHVEGSTATIARGEGAAQATTTANNAETPELQRRRLPDIGVIDALERPDQRGEAPQRQQQQAQRPERAPARTEQIAQTGHARTSHQKIDQSIGRKIRKRVT